MRNWIGRGNTTVLYLINYHGCERFYNKPKTTIKKKARKNILINFYVFIYLFTFTIWGFELRTSFLPGRHSTI
jgi:hypothetical protein